MNPFAVLAVTLFSGLLVSAWLRRRSVSLPIAFMLAGLALGPDGLGWFDLTPNADLTKLVVSLTLGLLLFAEASSLRIRQIVADANLEARLVACGVLASIGMGGALAWALLPSEKVGTVLLVGAALAPTDSSLSLPFTANPRVPERVRNALQVESGLSDGLVAPLVALFIPLAIIERTTVNQGWLADEARQIVIAIAIGALAGTAGGWLIRVARERDWTSPEMAQLAFMALAVATFFSSGNWEANRYIAAFVGGLAAGYMLRNDAHHVAFYAEETGVAMSFTVWVIFGAVLVPLALGSLFTWTAVAFAALALPLMRIPAVTLALAGFGLRRDTVFLVGWFGPRGLPSVAFLVTAAVAFAGDGVSTDALISLMTWTIMLSVVLHGISAQPLASWYIRRLEDAGPAIPESRCETSPHPADH